MKYIIITALLFSGCRGYETELSEFSCSVYQYERDTMEIIQLHDCDVTLTCEPIRQEFKLGCRVAIREAVKDIEFSIFDFFHTNVKCHPTALKIIDGVTFSSYECNVYPKKTGNEATQQLREPYECEPHELEAEQGAMRLYWMPPDDADYNRIPIWTRGE